MELGYAPDYPIGMAVYRFGRQKQAVRSAEKADEQQRR